MTMADVSEPTPRAALHPEVEWARAMARRLRAAAARVDGHEFEGVRMTKDEAERLAGAIEMMTREGGRR